MGDDKNPLRSPIEWVFRASLLLLGAVICLNLAVCFVRPLVPWIGGALVAVVIVWITVAVIRWRRSQW